MDNRLYSSADRPKMASKSSLLNTPTKVLCRNNIKVRKYNTIYKTLSNPSGKGTILQSGANGCTNSKNIILVSPSSNMKLRPTDEEMKSGPLGMSGIGSPLVTTSFRMNGINKIRSQWEFLGKKG